MREPTPLPRGQKDCLYPPHAVASGIVLPNRGDKFYPKRHFWSGIVLPIIDNQRITRWFLMRLG